MVYKNYFLLPQSYNLAETKKWIAKGHIKPVNENDGKSYIWEKNTFDLKEEADGYALAQMIMIIEDGKFYSKVDFAKATEPVYFTVEEVKDILKVSLETVRRYVRSGKLPAIKLGNKYIRIEKGDLEKFLKTLRI
jgi:excisionase family DNA binding protein